MSPQRIHPRKNVTDRRTARRLRTSTRTLRRSLFGPLVLVLMLGGALLNPGVAPTSASSRSDTRLVAAHHRSTAVMRKRHQTKQRRAHKHAARQSRRRPAAFARRTVRATRGIDRVSISWPARPYATGYTVTWSPTRRNIPTSPGTCRYPCQRRWTTGTSMVLTAAAMSTPGRRISSASGNTVQLKIFSQNHRGMSSTGIAYPWDSFIAPAGNASVDWLPVSSSQMPLPLPARAGRAVGISSFNVMSASAGGPAWSSRVGKVVKQINATGSSIVATQENSNVHTGVSGGVAQYKDLATKLRPSGWALSDARDWDRTTGKAHSDSTQGVRIYYRTNTWKQIANGALLTRFGFGRQTSGVNVDRWVAWTKLQSTTSPSTRVCVLSAHLLSNQGRYDKASANHRNAEMAQIMSELRSSSSKVRRVGSRVGAACAGTPMVFAADLNAAQEHAPYGNMPQATALAAGFVDAKNAGHRYNTRLSGPGLIKAWHEGWGTQIDYLLTKGMGGAKTFKLNTVAPSGAGSDHYPITALVNVPSS